MRFSNTFFNDINRAFIGFDDIWKTVEYVTEASGPRSYPKYNIIETDEGYIVEFAVAGFKREDLSVTNTDKLLTVSANLSSEDKEPIKYRTRQLARRSFVQDFQLGSPPEQVTAKLEDGVLTVVVKFPEKVKPTAISVKID
jgi:molecular chaperone IbpA